MYTPAYPSDLNDSQCQILEPLLPKPQRKGLKANVNLREINRQWHFYVLYSGCQWRAIKRSPLDFIGNSVESCEDSISL